MTFLDFVKRPCTWETEAVCCELLSTDLPVKLWVNYLRRRRRRRIKKSDKIVVLPISIPDSDKVFYIAMVGSFVDKRPLQKHSKLSKKPLNRSM